MRRPELIFLHSVSADGFDVPACDFQKLVALSQRGPDPSLPANSAAQQKRFASRISSALFATRSSRPGDATRTAKHRARLIAALRRLRDSKKEASRGMSSAPEVVIGEHDDVRGARAEPPGRW
jgi:hypothetical protein